MQGRCEVCSFGYYLVASGGAHVVPVLYGDADGAVLNEMVILPVYFLGISAKRAISEVMIFLSQKSTVSVTLLYRSNHA